ISNRTSSDVSQPQDEWIHAVTTCDGSVLKTFANGELISSLNINYSTIQSNSYDLLIGKGNNFFGGSIDDIRIYNYSLTDLEVDDLYQQEKPTEDNTNFQPIQIGQLIIEAEQITETTTNVFSATGNVNIGNKLFFDGELIVNRNDLTLSGNGRIYTKDIPQIGVLDLYDGEFSFEVEASAEKITSTILDKANQQFDLFNLPIHIEGISFLEDGIEINGQIVFPEVLDGVTAEIDQIKLTKSQGLDVVGMIDLHNKIKIHGAVTLSELLFQFDMDQNQFRGLGIIETALFDASTGVYIVEEGLDSVGVWVDVANPQPLGTTGLALAGAGGYVDGIQIPPLTIGLGTTLVIIGTPPEFLAFERLLLEYEFGTRMKGSGNFVLFGQALANAYFEIDKKRVALGVDVNFQDILIAYMKAAIMANDKNGIDFIGKFGGELQIPNGEGFEFEVLEQLLREALKDPTLTLPYSIAGSDNIIVNNKLRGRAWIVRPGRKDFKASYLIKFKNGKVTTKFIPGFRLYNEDVFSSPNARLQLEYLNEVHPESRFEGKSLVLRGSSDNSSSQTLSDEAITQDFIISTDIETIIVRVKGETSLPSFEISDPNGLVISSSSDFQNYQYMTNNEKNASFIIADLPIKGTYTISIVDEGDNYLVDVIGNEGDPGFMINEINQNDDVINIQWTDDNPFDDAEISFYLDEDKEGANGTPIELSISEDDETDNVEYEMTDELPGTYYIYGIMSDTLGNNVVSYYEEPITITTSLAAPTNLEFSLVDDALYLEWEKSVDCQNCDYLIFLDDSDQISTTSQNQNVGDTSNFTLTNLQFGQTYFITMAAQNDEGNLTSFSNTIEVELISTLVNNLPTVKSVSFPQQLTKGEHTTITFDLYDADSDILTLQAIKAPDNISISSNSIGWEASTIGLKQFVIGVYDQEGIGDSVQFFIEVFNEVLFSPSISTNKNQLEAYGESLVVSLRNPALINDNSQINLNAYTISNPDEVLALNLKSQDTKIGLFNGSISLDRDSNLAAAILQSSRTDTLVLSYSFDNSEIQYRIAFNGPNTPPENLSISNLTIDENQEDELIGRLSAFDFDEDLLEFSLANDIEQFKVSGDSLLTDLELNYEKKGEYDLQILVSDGTDEIASSFSITVNDINDAPTDILLSQDSIYENSEPGSLIGILSSEDEDENESFTYSFENSSDLFEIVSDKLLSKVVFDHEAQTNYNLEIKVVDKGSLSFLKSFNILIVDVDEPLGISNESKITVYPNPVSDILIIKSNSFKNATIYDLSGQEILRSNNKVIDMQSLIEGTYILRVVSDDPQAAAIRIHKK
ncbi:MAG: LamG-like jellyroll fold domain-containing protein, partial [Bacteroidota bacterium]